MDAPRTMKLIYCDPCVHLRVHCGSNLLDEDESNTYLTLTR